MALFVTCFNDLLFPETGKATVALLERLGHTVTFEPEQTCCGQMHLNTGYPDEAATLMRRFVETFADVEAVVAPSASCAGTIREAYPRLAERAGQTAVARQAKELGERVFDLTGFLVDHLGVTNVGASFPHTVTYHPTCHSLRSLHYEDKPLRLLRAVEGLELVELEAAEECCGFGGTFAVKVPEVSTAMLEDKMRHVTETGAEFLCAVDNSCLMHIGGGLSRTKQTIRPIHIAEILAATEATA